MQIKPRLKACRLRHLIVMSEMNCMNEGLRFDSRGSNKAQVAPIYRTGERPTIILFISHYVISVSDVKYCDASKNCVGFTNVCR